MKSNNKRNKNDNKLKKRIKKNSLHKNQKRMNNKEKANFSDMNSIEWFPIDPYSD